MNKLSSVPMVARGRGGGLRYAAIVAVFILFCGIVPFRPVAAAASLVNSANAVAGSNTNTVQVTITSPQAGNLLFVSCATPGTNTTAAPIRISQTGYTQAIYGSGTPSQGTFYKIAAGNETLVTCTYTKQRGAVIVVAEYSGIDQTSPFVAVNTVPSTGTSLSPASGSVTSGVARAHIVAAITYLSGSGLSNWTSSFTERVDYVTGNNQANTAIADLSTNTTGTYSTSATATRSTAYRGQIVAFRLAPGQLTVTAVDGSGNPIASPSITFSAASWQFDCQTASATLGTATQKIRVTNETSSPTWSLQIAPTDSAATARWASGATAFYDINDANGCTDGSDGDTYGGQLSVNPSASVIAPVGTGCSTTGISRGSASAFHEGTVDAIQLLTASSQANIGCSWDLTGVSMSQTIPDGQAEGTYSISLTISLQII